MVKWNQDLPEWKSKGVKPTEEYIENGWNEEERPPAEWFNWLFNRNYRSQKELRKEIEDLLNTIRMPRQIIKMDKTIDEIESFSAPGGTDRLIDVFKIEETGENQVKVIRDFDNTDETNFDHDGNFVEFTEEETSLKTDYQVDLLPIRSEGEGEVYEVDLDLAELKKVESVNVS